MSAGRQLLEISAAILIGYTFRARHLNAIFQQVQQIAVELAEEMLPQITTVTVQTARRSPPWQLPCRRDAPLSPGLLLTTILLSALP
mgnify:CR=1 FL=1